jgi:hypothetical protein
MLNFITTNKSLNYTLKTLGNVILCHASLLLE